MEKQHFFNARGDNSILRGYVLNNSNLLSYCRLFLQNDCWNNPLFLRWKWTVHRSRINFIWNTEIYRERLQLRNLAAFLMGKQIFQVIRRNWKVGRKNMSLTSVYHHCTRVSRVRGVFVNNTDDDSESFQYCLNPASD